LPTQKPGITTQPASVKVEMAATNEKPEGAPALTVVGATPDGGTLGYQWYKAATSTAAPTTDTKVGTNSASYTPTDLNTAVTSDNFYYVIVSNTKNGESKTITSSVVGYRVIDPSVVPMDIELVSSSHEYWDATEGGLVSEKDGGWTEYTGQSTGIILPIVTSFDADSYSRLEFTFIGYKADGTVASPATSQWNADFVPCLRSGATEVNFGWNASANPTTVTVGGKAASNSRWNITTTNGGSMAFSNGTCNVDIMPKNGTNSGANKIVKIVVTSVKLIAR